MDELGKVKRVIEKQAPVTEVLLVLDATTGQNGLVQARVFSEVVDVTGVVLTKLDGSAKGGIVVVGAARARRTGQAGRPRRGPRRPGAVRRRGVRRRAAGLTLAPGRARSSPSSSTRVRRRAPRRLPRQPREPDADRLGGRHRPGAARRGSTSRSSTPATPGCPTGWSGWSALRKPFVADELEGERGNGEKVVFRTPAPDVEPARLVAQREALLGLGPVDPALPAAWLLDLLMRRDTEVELVPSIGVRRRFPDRRRALRPPPGDWRRRRAQPAPRRLGRARGADADAGLTSVIVPTYDDSELTTACVESLLASER